MQRIVILLICVIVGARTPVALSQQSREQTGVEVAARQAVDDARARAAGIRKLSSRHLVLYTDLASKPEIDALPALFDRAVPQWAAYFGIDASKTADWRIRAFLIADRRPFDALGLMPADNNEFPHGLSVGNDVWLHEQPTAYYRRHLLLHEGTHAFMWNFLGGCGPGWYMEGMAELLATHRLDAATGELTLNIMPRDRREVPMLGRIKLIRDAFAAGRAIALPAVMRIDNRKHLGNEAYAWCWAATKFLDSHPRYRDRFRAIKRNVLNREFNDIVRREFADDWSELTAEWQAYVATLDHGYDFQRMAIDFKRGTPLSRKSQTGRGGRRTTTIVADRGWQSSGVWLEAGKVYHVAARGRYRIASERTDAGERPWPCEPGGVTVEYHDGRPLGVLLGAIALAEPVAPGEEVKTVDATFADPISIGLGCEITPSVSGTLYLRVNDAAGRLGDNRGTLTITIAD